MEFSNIQNAHQQKDQRKHKNNNINNNTYNLNLNSLYIKMYHHLSQFVIQTMHTSTRVGYVNHLLGWIVRKKETATAHKKTLPVISIFAAIDKSRWHDALCFTCITSADCGVKSVAPLLSVFCRKIISMTDSFPAHAVAFYERK